MKDTSAHTTALKIATALRVEYVIGTNWIEWHLSSGKEIKRMFKSEDALKEYLNNRLVALRLN